MSEAKHTPGPWSVDCNQFGSMSCCCLIVRSSRNDDNGVSDKHNGIMVIGIGDAGFGNSGYDDVDGPSLSYANAHLIAAAPELLHALTMVRDADNDCKADGLPTIPEAARRTIDSAIAKATRADQ